jgi:hypothetical protein
MTGPGLKRVPEMGRRIPGFEVEAIYEPRIGQAWLDRQT